jgi:hypothetical protein
MSVTGEALIVIMISLNYFDAARVPGSAMLVCMALVVLGNLGAQVGRTSASGSPISQWYLLFVVDA